MWIEWNSAALVDCSADIYFEGNSLLHLGLKIPTSIRHMSERVAAEFCQTSRDYSYSPLRFWKKEIGQLQK